MVDRGKNLPTVGSARCPATPSFRVPGSIRQTIRCLPRIRLHYSVQARKFFPFKESSVTADWKAEGHIVLYYPKNEDPMSAFPGIESLQKGVGARLAIQRRPGNSESVRSLFTTSHNAEGGGRLPADADDLRLSEVVQQLSGSGLDLIASSFSECSGRFTFNLGYQDQRIRGFTAGGSYETRSQSLRVDFSSRPP